MKLLLSLLLLLLLLLLLIIDTSARDLRIMKLRLDNTPARERAPFPNLPHATWYLKKKDGEEEW